MLHECEQFMRRCAAVTAGDMHAPHLLVRRNVITSFTKPVGKHIAISASPVHYKDILKAA